MKQRITEISVFQTSRIAAMIYAAIGVIVSAVMLVVATGMGEGGTREATTAIIMLFTYPILGFVGTALLATLYNFIAKRLGGIEFTTEHEPFARTLWFVPGRPNIDDELRSLAKLKEEGFITEEEFSQKKKALLGI